MTLEFYAGCSLPPRVERRCDTIWLMRGFKLACAAVAIGILSGCEPGSDTTSDASAKMFEATHERRALTPPQDAGQPTSIKTDGGTIHEAPVRSLFDFDEEKFVPVRRYIQERRMTLNYKAECLPIGAHKTLFLNGLNKRVCHLRAHPDFALLIDLVRDSGAASREFLALRAIRVLNAVDVVPTDVRTIWVPCTNTPSLPCEAFLEPWVDASAYRWWRGLPGDSHSLPNALSELATDRIAMNRACTGLHAWHRMTVHGHEIVDPQGAVGILGPDRGRLIIFDPNGLKREPVQGTDSHYAKQIQTAIDSKCGMYENPHTPR